ncbi:hypothetical protein MMC10_009292 [Thelotrema lepadinum]|nr:hypothetical protein [Thelotrema lepadinum]
MEVPCRYSIPLPKGRPSACRRANTNLSVPAQAPYLPSSSTLAHQTVSDRLTHPASSCEIGICQSPRSIPATSSGSNAAPLVDSSTTWPLPDGVTLSHPNIQIDWASIWSPTWTGIADPFDLDSTAGLPIPIPVNAQGTETETGAVREPSMLGSPANAINHESRPASLPRLWPPKPDKAEICISQLSELNTRLYPVYKTSRSYAAAQQKHSGALISAAAFDVVSILLEGSTTLKTPALQKCNAIFETFSASRHLLDIMHRLQASAANPAATEPLITSQNQELASFASDTAIDEARNDSWVGISSTQTSSTQGLFYLPPPISTGIDDSLEQGSMLSDKLKPTVSTSSMSSPFIVPSDPESSSHSVVICYLVLACYTRLLHIYGTFITALHHDASRAKRIGSGSPPSSVELRLVLLVQLIVHLLDSLQQVMIAYFSEASDRNNSEGTTKTSYNLRTPLGNADPKWPGLERISQLEVDIRHKLQQLQKTMQS